VLETFAGRAYLICCDARTGSNLLATTLRAVGRAGWPLEYFNRGEIDKAWLRAELRVPDGAPFTGFPRWRDDILRESDITLQHLQEDTVSEADLADRASTESERTLELRTRDRQRKLIGKIDAALGRLEDGSYGFCEETGEPIGLKRLEARPIATLSIEAQERHERRERTYRDD